VTPNIAPYTPSLYQPDSFGRYRHYPRNVRTPIPGAGYHVGHLAWAEQELNLDGSAQPQPYGNYAVVPLRGLGQIAARLPAGISASISRSPMPQPSGSSSAPSSPSPPPSTSPDLTQSAAAAIDAAAQSTQLLPAPSSFLSQKVGPVPYWAVGLGGLLLVGGGATWYFMRRKHVRPNRRR
jgi:hypothetical protein